MLRSLVERLKSFGFVAPVKKTITPSEQLESLTRKLAVHAEESDQVMFDGKWLTVEEAQQSYPRLQWESTLKFVEMLIFFFFLFVAVMMPFALLGLLGGLAL